MTEDIVELEVRGSEHDACYLWSDGIGDRVVVIIDDQIEAARASDLFPNMPLKKGLRILFYLLQQFAQIKGVGYFRLQDDSAHNDATLNEGILPWLEELQAKPCDVFALIDVFTLDEKTPGYGVCNAFEEALSEAHVAFLSQAGGGVGVAEDILGHGGQRPVFSKSEVEIRFRGAWNSNEKTLREAPVSALHPPLAKWLRLEAELGPVVWDAEKWCEIRDVARQCVRRLAPNYEDSFGQWDDFRAHHLPFGGQTWREGNKDYEKAISDLRDELRKGLGDSEPCTNEFPDYRWRLDKTNAVAAWAMPPIRAVAQFDRMARDLSTVFQLTALDVERLAYTRAREESLKVPFRLNLNMRTDSGTLHIAPAVMPFEHDYLWFNAPALAWCLYELAALFFDELQKAPWREGISASPPEDGSYSVTAAAIHWNFMERVAQDGPGQDIVVRQIIHHWADSERNRFSHNPQYMRFPAVDAASAGRIRTVYERLAANRCRLSVDKNGGLVISVPAVVRGDNVWEVFRDDSSSACDR